MCNSTRLVRDTAPDKAFARRVDYNSGRRKHEMFSENPTIAKKSQFRDKN
jgi:hypothetical protein